MLKARFDRVAGITTSQVLCLTTQDAKAMSPRNRNHSALMLSSKVRWASLLLSSCSANTWGQLLRSGGRCLSRQRCPNPFRKAPVGRQSTTCVARSIPSRCVSPLAAGVSPRAAAAPLHRGIPPAATRHCLPHQWRKGVGVKHRRRRRRLLLRGDAAIRLLLWRRGILLLWVLRRGCPVLLLLRRRAAAAAVVGWRAAVPTLGPKPWLWAHA